MLGIDRQAARYTWTAALILLLLWLVYQMRTTLFVFIVALLFAYLLSPLVNVIDRLLPTSRTRTPALAVAYLIFVAVLYVAFTQIGSRIVDEANSFGKSLPALLATWQQPSQKASPQLNSAKAEIIQKAREQVSKSSGNILAMIPRAGQAVFSVLSNLVYVVIVPILGFFFLKDGRTIAAQLVEMVENGPQRALLDDLLADTDLLLAHYMRAVLLLSLCAFAAYAVGFTIIGIPYGVLLAALAATLEFIPIIGPFLAGAIILVVTGASGGPLLGALVFLLIYRLLQDYVISPQLMGAGVELHPLFILFGVFAGAEIAGVPGAFLSVPVLAIVRIVYRRIRQVRVLAHLSGVKPVLTP